MQDSEAREYISNLIQQNKDDLPFLISNPLNIEQNQDIGEISTMNISANNAVEKQQEIANDF